MSHSQAMRGVLGTVAVLVLVGGLWNFVAFIWSSNVLSLWITLPLTLIAGVYVATQIVTPTLMGHQSEIEGKQREQQLRDSGAPLATTTSGGRIGILSFRRGQLRIVVFPGGILLKPWLVRSYAVLTSEITRLRIKASFVGDQHIEITCASALVKSPVTLHVSPGSDTARAIEHITGMVLALE